MYHFSLAVCKIFSLSLVFSSLIMIHLNTDIFGFILFGFYSTSWICWLMHLTKFGKFSAIISLNSFSTPCSIFFSFWDSDNKNTKFFFDIDLQAIEALLTIFSLLFRLGNFYCLSSSWFFPPLFPIYYCAGAVRFYFIFHIYIFTFYISSLYFKIYSIFADIFYFFTY